MDGCQATHVKYVLELLEPGYPSNPLVDERQLMVVREMPFVVVPRYGGLIDGVWWWNGKLVE